MSQSPRAGHFAWRLIGAVPLGMSVCVIGYATAVVFVILIKILIACAGLVVSQVVLTTIASLLYLIDFRRELKNEQKELRRLLEKVIVYIACPFLGAIVGFGIVWFIDMMNHPSDYSTEKLSWWKILPMFTGAVPLVAFPAVAGFELAKRHYRKALSIKFAAPIMVVGCFFGFAFFHLYCEFLNCHAVAMALSEMQSVHMSESRKKSFGIPIEPDSQTLDYAKQLRAIDVSRCPHDFQAAFEDYCLAWDEFTQFIERNRGVIALVKVLMTDGLSLLDAWSREAPERVSRINTARVRLAQIAENHSRLFEFITHPIAGS